MSKSQKGGSRPMGGPVNKDGNRDNRGSKYGSPKEESRSKK